MAFSCTMLLGLMGGLLWQTAMIKWELPCDYLTYVLVLYNFAVVGIAAIFYQKVRNVFPPKFINKLCVCLCMDIGSECVSYVRVRECQCLVCAG